MSTRVGARRLARVALLTSATALATACGPAGGDAEDRAAADLAQQLVLVHQRALSERAADPAGVDGAAADRLGRAITGGNWASVVSATSSPDAVEILTTAGARAWVGGGLSYQEATSGACFLTRATPGSRAGNVGERGTVSTEAVPCPDGVVPVVDSAPVEVTTTDVPGRRSSVPRPVSPGCPSGSGDCRGGGG